MHGNMSQEQIYMDVYRRNAAAQNRGPHFLRASAVEMHINMSQEPLCVEIYRKKCSSL